MPFQRRQLNGEKEPDRTQTGDLAPPEPGIAQTDSGIIAGSLTDESAIKAGTEVHVTKPGPREPVLAADGTMAPRWYRFFMELHRRTGGVQDNVNFVGTFRKLAPTTSAMALAGAAPSVEIEHNRQMTVGTLTVASEEPLVTSS